MINYFNVIFIKYPIGTVLKLKDDYPCVIRVVIGYEILEDADYLIFDDGTKLNVDNLGLIEILGHDETYKKSRKIRTI